MEQTKLQIPAEAVEAYTQYIHGEIDRRAFMSRVNKVAVSTVAAAAIVDQLMPNYAAAQQVSPSDARLKTDTRRCLRRTAMAASRDTSRDRQAPAPTSCRAFSSCTRTGA